MRRFEQMLRLPIEARRAWVKLLHVLPLFCPCRMDEAEARRIVDENALTTEEREAFRKHFPDGFFGGHIQKTTT